MANEFIWHDPVEAQQAMSYAANAARADLTKQENLYRMAELGLRKQQQQETARLNELLTQNQLDQRRIDNEYRDRHLAQQLEIAKMPSIREAEFNKRVQLEEEDRKRAEEEEIRIVTETEAALKELDRRDKMLDQLEKVKTSGSKNINLPVIEANIARVGMSRQQIREQRQAILNGMARSGYQYDTTTGKFMGVKRPSSVGRTSAAAPIAASQLQIPAPPAAAPMSLPQALQQPNIPVPSFMGMPPQILPQQDNLPRYETVQEALAAGHTSGQIVRVRHPITGVYARYQIE